MEKKTLEVGDKVWRQTGYADEDDVITEVTEDRAYGAEKWNVFPREINYDPNAKHISFQYWFKRIVPTNEPMTSDWNTIWHLELT